MAEIDSSIALNPNAPKPFNYGEAYGAGLKLQNLALQPDVTRQNILASQQEVQNMQAQEEAQRADNVLKQKAAAANQWMAENIKDYVDPETGRVDHLRLSAAAAKAGHYNEARAIAAADLNQDKAVQEFKRSGVVAASEKSDLIQKQKAYVANLISSLPANQQEAEYNRLVQQSETILPGSSKFFGKYSPEMVKSLKEATMSPQAQETLRMQKETHLLSLKDAFADTGPGTESAVAAMRIDFKRRHPEVPEAVADKMDGPAFRNYPGYKSEVEAEIASTQMTPEHRIAQEDKAVESGAAKEHMATGAVLASRMAGKYGIASAYIRDIWDKLSASEQSELQDRIEEYRQVTGRTIDPNTRKLSDLPRLFSEASVLAGERQRTASERSKKGAKLPAQGKTSAPTAEGGTTLMKRPDGKVGSIPTSEVQDAIKNGWKKA